MATVRLHTQHHPAGGLRPATPTCCSCSCCCVGSAVGTLAILPVMIARAVADQTAERIPVPPAPADEISNEQCRTAPPTPDKIPRAVGEGIAAFMLAALPVLITWRLLPDLEVVITVFIAVVVALTIWATIRAGGAYRVGWPPLVLTFVILPVAIAVEFYAGLGMTSGDSSGYWILATTIGAIVFGVGFLCTVAARRS